jgi:hypothetical protein
MIDKKKIERWINRKIDRQMGNRQVGRWVAR